MPMHQNWDGENEDETPGKPKTVYRGPQPLAGSRRLSHKETTLTPHNFSLTISVKQGFPKVVITRDAYLDMCCIVAESGSNEVGWLGTVKVEGHTFTIEKIFLPKQMVHGATCEITSEGVSNLSTELLSQPNGMEICNSIRFWGHVHPGNSTSPSGQDNDQMKIFEESCKDFFVRGILGKEGRMEFTVFIYKEDLIFHDVPWSIKEEDPNLDEKRKFWQYKIRANVESMSWGRENVSIREIYDPNTKTTIIRRVWAEPRTTQIGGQTYQWTSGQGASSSKVAEAEEEDENESPDVETAKERELAVAQLIEKSKALEKSLASRLLRWAMGEDLPGEGEKDPQKFSSEQLRQLIIYGNCNVAVFDEHNIRCKRLAVLEFVKNKRVSKDLIRGRYQVIETLAGMEQVALMMGRGMIRRAVSVNAFYRKLGNTLLSIGQGEFLLTETTRGYFPTSILQEITAGTDLLKK